tara:strand:+ start:215 stop:940 length:726 start_codon:yes stop_codon:yes gene_type:complete
MKILIIKFINSFLIPRFLYKWVINEKDHKSFLEDDYNPSILSKIIFFWPRITNALSWKEGKSGAYRDPTHFIELRPEIDEILLKKIISVCKNKDDSILDLGCNSGRHLNYLYNHGYKNLNGVDIMKSALDTFDKAFPNCSKVTNKKHDLFQNFLLNSSNSKYKMVYSVGATIELIHPSFDIIHEMCRVASKYICLLVQENSQEYPRFYVHEFKKNNFKLLDFERPIKNTNISFLFFRRKEN